MTYVPGTGRSDARLMIVAEAPGRYEDEARLPLVGPSGRLAQEILESVGGDWSAVYRTNVHKHRPPDNDLKRYHELNVDIKAEREQLWNEIHTIKPNAILAMGNVSLKALTGKDGIQNYRGSILESLDGFPKVIPTLHVSNLLEYNQEAKVKKIPYSARYYVELDFKRALEESLFRELRLPQRILQIARGAHDVYNFFNQYSACKVWSIDIESYRCIPNYISFAPSRTHAISIPLWNVPSSVGQPVHFSDSDYVEVYRTLIRILNDPETKIIGQNFKYDHDKLWHVTGIMQSREIYFDTSLAMHCLMPEWPKSLAFGASIYTKEPFYKDEYADFDPAKHPSTRVMSYNAKDAAVTFELYEVLLKDLRARGLEDYFFKQRMPLHKLYLDMEARGIRVDYARKRELANKYLQMLEELEKELKEIAENPEFNIRSWQQVQVVLGQLGYPKRDSTDENTLIALLANHGTTTKKVRFIKGILRSRKINKTLSTYLAAPSDLDGRMRTSYNISGTETGRSSTSNLAPPLRPEIYMGKRARDKKDVSKSMGLAFHTITKHGDIGSDLREMLIPDED